MRAELGLERKTIFDDLLEVGRWLSARENRTLLWVLSVLTIAYVALIGMVSFWHPDISWLNSPNEQHSKTGFSAVDLTIFFTWPVAFVLLGRMALRYKAQAIRLSKEIDAVHGSAYRVQIYREFNEERSRWYKERDEWKAKTQAELYEMILDQVERGVLKARPEYPDGSYDFPNRG